MLHGMHATVPMALLGGFNTMGQVCMNHASMLNMEGELQDCASHCTNHTIFL